MKTLYLYFLSDEYFYKYHIVKQEVSFEVHNQKIHINYHTFLHFHKIQEKLVLLILKNLNEYLIQNNI